MSFLGTRNAVSIGVSPHVTLGGPNLLNKLSPSLLLNFAGAETLDPRITFTRATTATFTGSNGLIQTAAIDAPRFDYNPATLAPLGLLIEEQRTNLVLYSEQFDDAAWTKTRSSITADATTSPDGTVDADKLVENTTASSTHFVRQLVTLNPSTSYAVSFYAKAAERSQVVTRLFSSMGWVDAGVRFDLIAGTTTTTSGSVTSSSITSVGNGWYRCVVVQATDATTTIRSVDIQLSVSNSATYTGDGFSGVFIWGAQLEAGAFPTSYIPTVASQVTRSADVAVMTGANFSSWYNQTEGTMYAESAFTGLVTSARIAQLDDGTTSNFISLQNNPSTATSSQLRVFVNGTNTVFINTNSAYAANTFAKTAAAIAVNNFATTVNSAAVGTDTSSGVPVVNTLRIGASSSAVSNVLIKRIAYYPRRLANSELQAITA
jgi:hypothetical protein